MPGQDAGGPEALASSPLFDESPVPVLCVSARDPGEISREISRRKALLASLLAAAGAALAAGTFLVLRRLKKEMDLSRLKTDFLANLSHDLRTPLSVIRSAAETLHMGRVRDPDKARRYLEIVLKEAGRIEGMIGNVMDAARFEIGRKTLHLSPIAPGELIAGVEKARRLLLEEAGFALEVAVAEDVPAILGDRDALGNALLNLVENAVKYSPERKEIRLTATARDGEAVLSVEDRGMGIPPEEKAGLFERFHRAGPAVHTAGGVGLGLSLVLATVRAHGGRIEVEPREGRGTRFSMAFPAAVAKAEDEE